MSNNTDDRSYTPDDLDAILAEFASFDPSSVVSEEKPTPKAAPEAAPQTPQSAAPISPAKPAQPRVNTAPKAAKPQSDPFSIDLTTPTETEQPRIKAAPKAAKPQSDPFGVDLTIPSENVQPRVKAAPKASTPQDDPFNIDLSMPSETAQPKVKAAPKAGRAQDDSFGVDLTMPAEGSYVPVVAGSSSAARRAPAPPPQIRADRYSGSNFEETFGRKDSKAKNAPKVRGDVKSSSQAPHPASRKQSAVPAPDQPETPKKGGALSGIICIVFILLSVFALGWTAYNVHPSSDSAASAQGSKLDLVSRMDVYMNNSASDALGDLAYIKKIYKIDENDTVAPVPDSSKFGTVSPGDAVKVMDIVQQAKDSGLLDGQEIVFNPDIDFVPDSTIQYYCDETILVICWKELIGGNTCSLSEVKIADPSQFRRKISDDTYGSSSQYYATTMYKQVNAVVAMNSDNYTFRNMGIIAYQRQLYRFNTSQYTGIYSLYNCLDNCFVTAEGNFLFMRKGEQTTAAEVEQFMADNNVLFTISFGPVLVDDGVVQTCDWYPCGEYNTGYSRAGIGQLGELHYLYMSLNHSSTKAARWTVNEFAQHFADKGVIDAYNLDGGQTGEVVFQGEPFNYMDYGNERLVSDIIYFATAIPSEEVTP